LRKNEPFTQDAYGTIAFAVALRVELVVLESEQLRKLD